MYQIDNHFQTADFGFAEKIRFLAAFLRSPVSVGALVPSSPALGRAMLSGCELDSAGVVVELGPGTGAFTRIIVERVARTTKVIALEIDGRQVRTLRRHFPMVKFVHDSAENLTRHLPGRGRKKADCIISGLPWVNMSVATRNRIVDAVLAALRPGGVFVAFGYVHASMMPSHRHFRQRLLHHFDEVTRSRIVWNNLPPAFVYRCR